ncbi:hypothetical protein CRENBAI_013643 [Crenichthys baileyi]|uniref:Uncharacterized protein n=1 Tax=Crenichthys baileyi TaxID=28760 RepID=A0AAV9S0K4_9TELE
MISRVMSDYDSASGKYLNNSYNPPAERRRGRPASTPAPAAASLTPQASTSSSTPTIPQSSVLHSSRPWILSTAPYHPLLHFSRSPPPILPRQHFLFSSLPALNLLLDPSH